MSFCSLIHFKNGPKYLTRGESPGVYPLDEISAMLLSSYLPNPSARAGYDTRSIFKRSLTGFNSEFSFS